MKSRFNSEYARFHHCSIFALPSANQIIVCWLKYVYVVCLKGSVNGTRKQTKQRIQTNKLYWPSK
jgi:hypothetical protein